MECAGAWVTAFGKNTKAGFGVAGIRGRVAGDHTEKAVRSEVFERSRLLFAAVAVVALLVMPVAAWSADHGFGDHALAGPGFHHGAPHFDHFGHFGHFHHPVRPRIVYPSTTRTRRTMGAAAPVGPDASRRNAPARLSSSPCPGAGEPIGARANPAGQRASGREPTRNR
jgi:hypothetical protein